MADRKVVLITGVAGYWGSRLAEHLIDLTERRQLSDSLETDRLPQYHVIGVDSNPPKEEIDGLDFVQADIRNPLLVDLIRDEGVHTVCHLAFWERYRLSEATFDFNVIGTMKLIGACGEAGVKKVILRSSTMVYGARPSNPAFLTEDHPLGGSKRYGYTRDWLEIENFCSGFQKQMSEMTVTLLRFPSIIGPEADTPMTRFLKQAYAPCLLGFDPRMQVIHEEDVLGALVYAVENDFTGACNIAADGIIPLNRLIVVAGKIPLPLFHPIAYLGANVLETSRLNRRKYEPIEWDYLRYSWVADLRRMQTEIGFVPRYTAEEALREFSGYQRLRRHLPESLTLAFDEARLRDTLERRSRARIQHEIEQSDGDGGKDG